MTAVENVLKLYDEGTPGQAPSMVELIIDTPNAFKFVGFELDDNGPEYQEWQWNVNRVANRLYSRGRDKRRALKRVDLTLARKLDAMSV